MTALTSGAYQVRVTASDARGNAASLTQQYLVDRDAPPTPENLRVTPGQVTLIVSWDSVVSPDFSGYQLSRSADGGAFQVVLASTTSTVYIDHDVQLDPTYAYRLTAADNLGNVSAATAVVSADAFVTTEIMGSFGHAEFSILAMDFSPGNLHVTTSKNSSYSRTFTLSNLGEDPLTGLGITLIDDQPNDNVTARLIFSAATTWPGGADMPVTVALDIPENAPDQVSFTINAVTAEGVRAVGRVRFTLKAPVAMPSINPGTVRIGLNPGGIWGQTISLTNTGLGTMRNIIIVPPVNLPWVSVAGLQDATLAPGATTTFDLLVTATYVAFDLVTLQPLEDEVVLEGRVPIVLPSARTVTVTYGDGGQESMEIKMPEGGSGNLGDEEDLFKNCPPLPQGGGTVTEIVKLQIDQLRVWRHDNVIIDWVPDQPGEHTITACLRGNFPNRRKLLTVVVNARPYADAGADFFSNVLDPTTFDGTRSVDTDGFVRLLMWDMDDGAWTSGMTPTHVYASSGTYRVHVIVKDDVGAMTEDVMQVTVRETRPDLTVDTVTVTPSQPQEGAWVTLTATIRNVGVAAVAGTPFHVGLYVDGRYQGLAVVDQPLAVGQSASVSFTWQAVVGNHLFTFVADDMDNAVREAHEGNNEKTVALYPDQVYFPDLVVTDIAPSVGPEDPTPWGAPIQLTATICNQGNAPAGAFRVTFYVDAQSVGYAVVDGLDFQAGSNTATASVWWVPTGGEHRLYAFADYPISHILESNERNNNHSETIGPLNIIYGDLRVTDFALWPPTGRVQAGDPVYAFLTVRNDSQIDIPASIPVQVRVDGVVVAEDSVDGLGPNEAKTIRVQWYLPAGTHTLRAVADPGNVVPEIDETNNAAELPNVLITALQPDLTATDLAIVGAARAGQTVQVVAKIVNRGTGYAGAFNVRLLVDGELVMAKRIPAGLAAGSFEYWFADWPIGESAASVCDVSVVVDANQEVVESAEGNNAAEQTVAVQPGYLLDLTLRDHLYLTGEAARLYLTVQDSASGLWLTPAGGINASVTIYNAAGTAVLSGPMTYDAGAHQFTFQAQAGSLPAGSYLAVAQVTGQFQQTTSTALTVTKDFTLTAGAHQAWFGVGQAVTISGQAQLTDGTPVAGAEVDVYVTHGQIVRLLTAVTRADGTYDCVFQPYLTEGGSYAMSAAATVGGLERRANAGFTIKGLRVDPAGPQVAMSAGSTQRVVLTVTNLGTLPLTGPVMYGEDFINTWFGQLSGGSATATGHSSGGVKLSQDVATERETLSLNLRLSNVLADRTLTVRNVAIEIRDQAGAAVTSSFAITRVVDPSGSLAPLGATTGQWQLTPLAGLGLGGTTADGQAYDVIVTVDYDVDARSGQIVFDPQTIVIKPQPAFVFRYEVQEMANPANGVLVTVSVTNTGYGAARRLEIGLPQMGVATSAFTVANPALLVFQDIRKRANVTGSWVLQFATRPNISAIASSLKTSSANCQGESPSMRFAGPVEHEFVSVHTIAELVTLLRQLLETAKTKVQNELNVLALAYNELHQMIQQSQMLINYEYAVGLFHQAGNVFMSMFSLVDSMAGLAGTLTKALAGQVANEFFKVSQSWRYWQYTAVRDLTGVINDSVGQFGLADFMAVETNFGRVVGIEPSQVLAVAATDMNDGGHHPWLAQSLALSFTADAVVPAAALTIHSDTTGCSVPVPAGTPLTYTAATRTARWDLAGLALPPGRYTATLHSSLVATPFGWALGAGTDGSGAADYTHSFLVTFVGDADLNGSVDMADYMTVKGNLGGTTGMTWSQGDFDDDGDVDLADLEALEAYYGATIDAPHPAAAVGAAVGAAAVPTFLAIPLGDTSPAIVTCGPTIAKSSPWTAPALHTRAAVPATMPAMAGMVTIAPSQPRLRPLGRPGPLDLARTPLSGRTSASPRIQPPEATLDVLQAPSLAVPGLDPMGRE